MNKEYEEKIKPMVPKIKGGLVGGIVVLIVFLVIKICYRMSGTSALLPNMPYISCMIIYAFSYIICMMRLYTMNYKLECITKRGKSEMGNSGTDHEISHNDGQFLDK